MEEEDIYNESYSIDIEESNTTSEISGESSRPEEVKIPECGMEFLTEEEVRKFYKYYGKSVGFGISKLNSKKKDGEQKYFSFGCCKNGNPTSQAKTSFYPRPSSKTDCKAKINVVVRKNQGGKVYVITGFFLKHNHDLSPGKSRYFRCNKQLDSHAKRKLEMNDQAGIGVSKTYESLVVEAGGYENLPFDERTCRNYVTEARNLRLGIGDAEALNNYFCRMQKRNSNFFYVIDAGGEDLRIKNIFWADARCRAAYEYFPDVVTFDTTYLTNSYDMPFAPFVGVNHHGESILLGCGLISREDTETFIWLFKSWLTCMGARAPQAIITDQCRAMEIAIAEVFPNSRHRLCLWHIMKKLPEKLSGYEKYEEITNKLKDAVYESLTTDEFDDKWARMIQEFDLENNAWLNTMYGCRHKWIPAYVKDKFWAGMSSSQRSESMNAFFDGYVHSKTTLKQFVEQYDSALRKKMQKEKDSDFASFNSTVAIVSGHIIEKQMQNVYTINIFKKFQDEVRAMMLCNTSFVMQEGPDLKFEVVETILGYSGSTSKEISFRVHYNELHGEVICLCHLFEFKGILCRHVVAVLNKRNVTVVPERYILERWRKDIKRGYQSIVNVYEDLSVDKDERKRYYNLNPLLEEVQQLGSKSDDKFSMLVEILTDARNKLIDGQVPSNEKNSTSQDVNMTHDNLQVEAKKLRSPLKVRSRGRPPTKRKQSTVEKIVKKAAKKPRKKKKQDELPDATELKK